MKYIKIILIIIFSCKRNVKEKISRDNIKTKEVVEEKQVLTSENGNYELPEYYNPTSKLGIGLVKTKKDTLFFKSSINSSFQKESIYNPKSIIPIFFKPDYNIFYTVCVEKINKTYKVLSANSKYFFVQERDFEFISWENFLIETTGIENMDWGKNPLREKPNSSSIKLPVKSENDFVINEIQGDWIEVENEDKDRGWIKWRENEKLLIEIYLLM
ncbi:hypothetical protein [Tenacibaculum sp. SDUM215027]|uniref:hypothetical protein n=1 Tax=Tenacibaculum sp. SDUM215027 TaxID=3422596 RepID=UPI003D314905